MEQGSHTQLRRPALQVGQVKTLRLQPQHSLQVTYHCRSETPRPALYHKSLCNTMSSGVQKYNVRPTSGTSSDRRRCILTRANGVSCGTNTSILNIVARWMTLKLLQLPDGLWHHLDVNIVVLGQRRSKWRSMLQLYGSDQINIQCSADYPRDTTGYGPSQIIRHCQCHQGVHYREKGPPTTHGWWS